jgi:hypothetical protein
MTGAAIGLAIIVGGPVLVFAVIGMYLDCISKPVFRSDSL